MVYRARIVIAVAVLAAAAPAVARAHIAAGIVLGKPAGLSVLFSDRAALGAAWSIPYNRLHLHGDLRLLSHKLAGPVDWFLGVGTKLSIDALDDENTAGVLIGTRVPVGIRHFVIEQLELFLELAPGVRLFPDIGPDIDAGIGVRYHFSAHTRSCHRGVQGR